TIADDDLRASFFSSDGTNYLNLVDQTVDLYTGRAFITEYAQPTSALRGMNPSDKLVQLLSEKYGYVTRFFGRISPEEMTVDPVFDFDAEMATVSNTRDLSGRDAEIFWGCTDEPVEIKYDPE